MTRAMCLRFWSATFVFSLALLVPTSSLAQLPYATLKTIFPPGGKAGTEVDLKITGDHLYEAKELHFSHAGIKAAPKMAEPDMFHKAAYPLPGEFKLSIDKNVPPGIYEVRVVSRFGISNPRAFAVSDREELIQQESNDTREKALPLELGKLVNAQAKKEKMDYYRLSLTKGQSVLIECWGRRIDSRMDPTLLMYGPGGRELEQVRDVKGRDPVMHFTAPAAGDYTLAVYDFVYEGGAEYPYRLLAGNGPFIDFVFPPVGTPGSNGQYTVYGRNLPGGKPADGMTMFGDQLQQLTTNIALPGDAKSIAQLPIIGFVQPHQTLVNGGSLYQLSGPQGKSNAVTIHYATAPVVVENEPQNNEPQQAQGVEIPCELVGQFYPARDRDWISFPLSKGDVVWLNVFSHRLAASTDAMLIIQKVTKNENGEEQVREIATVDDPARANNDPAMFDTHSYDPSYRLQADEDATYRVLIKDNVGSRSDPRSVYRLLIHKQQPDFHLVAYPEPARDNRNQISPRSLVLRRGGAAAMTVRVVRRNGFNGEVEITAEGLPRGVTCQGATIGGKVKRGWIVFQAADNAQAVAGPIRVTGKAKVDGKDVVREARGGAMLWGGQRNQPIISRATRELTLAVIDSEQAPISIAAGDGKPIETAYGGKFEVPVKVTKRGEVKGNVKVEAVGLSRDWNAKAANVGDNGKLTFELRSDDVPTGTYTLYFRGQFKARYNYNQDAVKKAEEEQEQAQAILKEWTDKANQTKGQRDQAVRDAQTAQNELNQAQQNMQNAEREEKDAANRVKEAEQKVAQAKKEADANKDDDGKKQALENAQKELTQRQTEQQDKAKKLEEANKKLEEAKKNNEAAQKSKQETETAYNEAEENRKKADGYKRQADARAKDVKNKNKPRDLDLFAVSSPVRIRVAEHPLKVTVKSPAGKVKQGEKLEIPVSIERLYGFTEKVDLQLELPGGAKGIGAKNISIDKGKKEAKIELSANADATPGSHTATIKLRHRFNNVNLEPSVPVTFEVEAAEKKE